MPELRQLHVFLCHASQDKPAVRELYKRLKTEPWIAPWLDEEELLPGQDWDLEIYKALRDADAIIVCLSQESVAKEGYVQKEFKRALNLAEEKPEGTIYIIPLRLNDCQPPIKFQQYQWVDYFAAGAHEKLLKSLRIRFEALHPEKESSRPVTPEIDKRIPDMVEKALDKEIDLYSFIKINSRAVGQPFWISKYPVTNSQYERFLKSDDYANLDYWIGFPKFDEKCQPIGDWGDEGLKWLNEQFKDFEFFPPETWKVEPSYWKDPKSGIAQPDNPVIGITWYEANAYCKWLFANWDTLPELRINSGLKPALLRLPLETEWVAAAGGDKPEGRYPWDLPGKATIDENEILKRANVAGKIGHTTSVKNYPDGRSPFGVMDMAGNVWEWQANLCRGSDFLALRGGSWDYHLDFARVANHYYNLLVLKWYYYGFRVAIQPL